MSLSRLELKTAIEQIEADIVLREARLRGRVADLGQRVDAALPKVAVAGVVAAALGLLVLWMRPRRPAVAAPAASGAEPSGWLHWVSLAWPMLPLSLRAMVDLRLVMAIGKPLLSLFKRRRAPPTAPPPPHQQQQQPADAVQKHG